MIDYEDDDINYQIDDELSNILNPEDDEKFENSLRMRRAMQKSQYKRVVRQKKAMFANLRRLLRFIITLIILYCVYRLMTATRWYLPKDTISSYKIKRIQIIGNKITPTYKIVSAISDIELPHKPIYMIKTDEFSQKISSLAPVKKVYVKRLWSPARIIIYVEEKEPILTIAPSETSQPIAFFSKEGTLVGREYLPLAEDYNPFLILTYGNKDDYTKWDKNKVANIEKLAKTMEKYSGEKIEYIDMRNPQDIYIKLTSANIRVGTLDSTTYHRIKDIKSILKKTHPFENKIKYIDLSWEESKYIKLGTADDKQQNAEDSDSTDKHE